ncbi:MAG: undecaprenyl/decaprenyl-phosphate alpha-N-acetylglucosaminyl 1-phosphate transferase [candidate division KSB1 bacterium]|nr:undecaprenyl/decaprenyl-phosphate alpha-N-acetylglucosaminyl 1-phosphate transferase [candidate division KSB1 bacterium]
MGLLLGTCLLAFSVSIALTPLVRKLAFRFDAVARPNHRTIHQGLMPKFGGLAVFIAFLAGILLLMLFADEKFAALQREALVFLFSGTIILALGIYDDLKGANSNQKFLVQLISATIVVLLGYRISAIANPFGAPVELGIFSIPFTLLWIVGITNAINLIDGLDGLAAGISFGGACMMVFISLWFGNLMSAFPAAILAGAIGGFLIYNFNPARIFLGDSGSLLIGFLLACFSINGTFRESSAVAIYIPMVVLGIPILDTFLAILRRIRKGLPLFQADREHIHHRLLQLGVSHKHAVLLLNGVSYAWGIIAFAIYTMNREYSWLLLLPVFGTIIFGMRKLGFVKYFLLKSSSQ